MARPVVLVFGADAGLVRERVEKSSKLRSIILTTHSRWCGWKATTCRAMPAGWWTRPTRSRCSAESGRFGESRRPQLSRFGRGVAGIPPEDCRVIIEAGDLRRTAPLRACASAQIRGGDPLLSRRRPGSPAIDQEMRAPDVDHAGRPRRAAAAPGWGPPGLPQRDPQVDAYAHGKDQSSWQTSCGGIRRLRVRIDVIGRRFAGRIRATPTANSPKPEPTAPRRAHSCRHSMRQLSSLHKMRSRSSKAEARSGNASHQPAIHFSRKPLVDTALQVWTAERFTRVMQQIAEAALEVRRQPISPTPSRIARCFRLPARSGGNINAPLSSPADPCGVRRQS